MEADLDRDAGRCDVPSNGASFGSILRKRLLAHDRPAAVHGCDHECGVAVCVCCDDRRIRGVKRQHGIIDRDRIEGDCCPPRFRTVAIGQNERFDTPRLAQQARVQTPHSADPDDRNSHSAILRDCEVLRGSGSPRIAPQPDFGIP